MAKQQDKTKAEFLAAYCSEKEILAERWASMEEVTDFVYHLKK